MKPYCFELKFKVRDYECDLQGVVNNGVYQHYLEHGRHEFLASKGVNFKKMIDRGVMAMVSHIEMSFKGSLTSGDEFVLKLWTERQGAKLVFFEDIFRLPEMKPCMTARVEAICLVNGKLTKGDVFDKMLAGKDYLP